MRTTAAGLALLLLVLGPLTGAQPPTIEHEFSVTSGDVPATETELDPGSILLIEATFSVPEINGTAWRVFLFGQVGDVRFEHEPIRAQANDTPARLVLVTNAVVPMDAEPGTNVALTYNATVQSLNLTQPNATWVEQGTFEDTIVLSIAAPPPAPGTPVALYIGAGLIIGLGLAVVALAKRKPRQVKTAPRSKAMQEIRAETKRGNAPGAEPEAPSLPPQLTILEARAADVRRMVELARQRMERGELTEHQFKTIRERKEAELQTIEEDIEQLRGSSEGS